MSAPAMTRVGSTLLYQPPPPESRYVAFLLWAADDPPASIDVRDVWSQAGAARYSGWFLCLEAAVRDGGLEQALRGALPPPASTSFAWLRYEPGELELRAVASVSRGQDGLPVLAEQVVVELPRGELGLTLPAGAPVLARDGLGAFVFAYPPGAGLPSPRPAGISVPLTGAGIGALAGLGLVEPLRRSGDAPVRKSLVYVQIDPVRPLDGARTFQALMGRDFLLVDVDGRYRLVPA